MKYVILGFGAGTSPLNTGIQVGVANCEGYARDIVDALAKKHVGQWWGYEVVNLAQKVVERSPCTRLELQTWLNA